MVLDFQNSLFTVILLSHSEDIGHSYISVKQYEQYSGAKSYAGAKTREQYLLL